MGGTLLHRRRSRRQKRFRSIYFRATNAFEKKSWAPTAKPSALAKPAALPLLPNNAVSLGGRHRRGCRTGRPTRATGREELLFAGAIATAKARLTRCGRGDRRHHARGSHPLLRHRGIVR